MREPIKRAKKFQIPAILVTLTKTSEDGKRQQKNGIHEISFSFSTSFSTYLFKRQRLGLCLKKNKKLKSTFVLTSWKK